MAKSRNERRVSDQQQDAADVQIRARQREIDFDIRDFPVEVLVKKFRDAEFYIPDYQREFIWRAAQRSRFIESVLLGLPIPMMFFAEMDDGKLEIVDGAQRIQTLESFLANDFALGELKKLPACRGFRFVDLPVSQQRKTLLRPLRVVILEEKTTSDIRHEIFDRINTSGVRAKPSEVRRGAFAGAFMSFVEQCANSPLLLKLCPISPSLVARREPQELVLRFFAYSERYREFRHDVEKFLNSYVEDNRTRTEVSVLQMEYDRMLQFVDKHFPFGFAKSKQAKTTPRVRFEALSVGVNLALRERPDLVPTNVHWIESREFAEQTTTHASNSGPRLRGRVEYVRDQLLAGAR